MTRRILLIGNKQAGTSDRAAMDAALEVLRSEAEVDVVETGSMEELTDAIAERGDAEVVVAGGDGSLHAFATALCITSTLGEDPPTVGLIPLGTGNDFARTVAIPLDAAAAARVVLEGEATPIDVLQDEDKATVVNAVHIGVGEEAGRVAAPWKELLGKVKLGALGYVIGGLAAGFGQRGRLLEVVADDVVLADGQRRVLQAPSRWGRAWAVAPSWPPMRCPATGSPRWSSRSRWPRSGGCATPCTSPAAPTRTSTTSSGRGRRS